MMRCVRIKCYEIVIQLWFISFRRGIYYLRYIGVRKIMFPYGFRVCLAQNSPGSFISLEYSSILFFLLALYGGIFIKEQIKKTANDQFISVSNHYLISRRFDKMMWGLD